MATLALCIPAYNAAIFLPKLLQSAKNQHIPFDEILVYNDCSTDNTAQVAETYGAKVIAGNVNRGCSYGKNALANITFCEWIHFHDADDDILPDFTTKVHQWINNNQQYDILLLNFRYVDYYTGNLLGMANHIITELYNDPVKYTIQHKIVNFGIYHREKFLRAGGFDLDPQVLHNEDNAFHQRLAQAGLKFDYLPEVTCINYRYKKSMSTQNELECARANYHVLEKTASKLGNKYPAEIAEQIWYSLTILASFQDFVYVKKGLKLTQILGYKYPPTGSWFFVNLAKLNPYLTILLREKLIRLFKPHLRKND